MNKLCTFEEACKISSSICTGESFRIRGVQAVMKERRVALAVQGWTSQELCEESRRRLLVTIAERRKEES